MEATTINSPILADLRLGTSEMHTALEERVDILSSDLNLERYKFILKKFYGFYAPVENRLAALRAYEALQLDPAPRYKTFRIVNDLKKLGLSSQEIEALPSCPNLPELISLGQALGSLYVLEGATLGGQIIRRELRKRPDFAGKECFELYNSYGKEVGSRWKEFCAGLNRFAVENLAPELRRKIITSAVQTFERLDAWLAD